MEKPFYIKQLYGLSALVFIILFILVFTGIKGIALEKFNEANQASPAIKMYSSNQTKVSEGFSKYGMYAGIIFGILLYMATRILGFFLGRKPLRKIASVFIPVLCLFLLFGFIYLFEPRMALIANGIIFFIAYPMFYTTGLLSIGLLAWALPMYLKGSGNEK